MQLDVFTMTVNGVKESYIVDLDTKTIIAKSFENNFVMETSPVIETVTAKIGNTTTIEVIEPDYYKTGIKIKDGVEHYRMFYKCFNCSSSGKHYIPKDVTAVYCHECTFELPVKPATPLGFPNRDTFGNFFTSTPATDTKQIVKRY